VIAEAEGITIADLVEPKLIELIAVYDKRMTWARPDSNRRPSPRKGFNKLTIREIYKKYRNKFTKHLNKKVKRGELSERTAKDYISALDKNLKDVFYPDELEELILRVKGDKFAKGLRNFFNFLEEEIGLTHINGVPLERWRKKTIIRKYQAREVFISDDELREAYYSHIRKINDEELEMVFLALVYSGLRLKHVVEALQQFDPSNVVKVNDMVYRYPVGFVSKGKKKAFWLYFPSWLELRKISKSYDYLEGVIKHGRVSANTIRKWNYNFLIMNGVPESVADFIQGRASVTVGSSHYLAKTKQADEWYSRIVDKFPIR